MAKDLIYKINGAFQYSGDIEQYIHHEPAAAE